MKLGTIYFIACEPVSAVKIGFTQKTVAARLSALQTGCPAPLRVMATVPGSLAEERLMHLTFAPLHIQGEWFRLDGKLLDLVRSLDAVSTREAFEDMLHDVVLSGVWSPNHPTSFADHELTANRSHAEQIVWAWERGK